MNGINNRANRLLKRCSLHRFNFQPLVFPQLPILRLQAFLQTDPSAHHPSATIPTMIEQTHSYDDLKAWQEATTLAVEVLRNTPAYPSAAHTLATETLQTAIQIPASIAEGWIDRFTTKEIRRHLGIARGSLVRLEIQLILALRLEYLTRQQMDAIWPLTQSTGSLVAALLKSL